jgi:ribonuclease HI
MKEVFIYTDGSCHNGNGTGGWSAILRTEYQGEDIERIVSGNEENTTNNRMEMKAAIEGLRALREPCKVSVYTDSGYLYNAMTGDYIESWRARNWLTREDAPVKNQDLWEELDTLCRIHAVSWVKVIGHSGFSYNERADEIAGQARRQLIEEVVTGVRSRKGITMPG